MNIQISARDMNELRGLLRGMVKENTLTQKDVDKIMEKATITEYQA